jgi:predicted N-acyltransferase
MRLTRGIQDAARVARQVADHQIDLGQCHRQHMGLRPRVDNAAMQDLNTGRDYVTRVYRDPAKIDRDAWSALVERQTYRTPFLSWDFLCALHASLSAVDHTGWAPHFVTVWDGGDLVAACPAYLKSHSYGEFVFDWSWAEAYAAHGLSYYPKLVVGVPFTPVGGTRLLAQDAAARAHLLSELPRVAQTLEASSVHVLFASTEEVEHARREPSWLIRRNVQFHWQRPPDVPMTGFEDLLRQMHREKRKKIVQEQRKVRDAGIHFERRSGDDLSDEDWDFFYRCHQNTYAERGGSPYLTRAFFELTRKQPPGLWLMVLAYRNEQRVACALVALDPNGKQAYGRYWGALETVPCLHFATCYYEPLAWCIEHGYLRFEGGAQGTHKISRGLEPVATHSLHWIADERFRHAIARFLMRETPAVDESLESLSSHTPFRRQQPLSEGP